VKKNTKGELQNPFNQFCKILLYGSYRQIVLLCKPDYFHKHFLLPDQPGFGNKISFGWNRFGWTHRLLNLDWTTL